MRKKMAIGAALGSAFLGGALLSPIGMASAGHTNDVLAAELSGRQEVPKGDPNGRGEAYVFGIDGDTTTLCYVLTVQGIGAATAAHIHEGAPGENGPVVVNLAAPADGNAADCLSESEEGKFVDGQTAAEILANPEDYYVNVHNTEYPGGAIRGQLEER